MHKRLGARAAAIEIPYFDKDDNFIGIVDLVEEELITYTDVEGINLERSEIPQEHISESKMYREELIEQVIDIDETLFNAVAHGEQINNTQIKEAIRRGVKENKFTPVLCGTSLRNKGVQLLLDAVCDYLPSPLDVPPAKGLNPETSEYVERAVSEKAPFCALCFKVVSDPYVGRLSYLRIYSGKIKAGTNIYNATRRITEKVTKIVHMHANKQEIIEEVSCGEIAALVGLKDTKTGDTLCDKRSHVIIEEMKFPEPVLMMAIEPKTKIDQERLGYSLKKMSEEDPSFKVTYNQETGETIISGMGQLHLSVLIDRMLREFSVEAKVGKPQVAYKETITKKISTTGKFIQQSGGRGQYGHVVFTMEPLESGMGLKFEDRLKGGVIPREFISSVKEGVMDASKSGVIGSFAVTDVQVTLVDGSFHEVDSSELAFKMAASIAFTEGLRKGNSILLEPIMDIEIVVPEEYMGAVIGDFNTRRGKVISLGQRGNVKLVRGYIPLVETFDYATALRSLTQGRASYIMEPSFYQEVPEDISHKLFLNIK